MDRKLVRRSASNAMPGRSACSLRGVHNRANSGDILNFVTQSVTILHSTQSVKRVI